MLTFLCIVYKRKYKFPPQRSELYRAALDIILEEWAAHKRLKQEPIYPQWNTALEKELLAHIAYDNFSQNQVFFPEQELVDYIKDFLADTVDNPKYLDGKAVLKAIALQQGILVERPTPVAPSWEGVGGGFSFSHLTFQEYLTALYISKSSRRIQQLVVEHLEDKRWREVFLLVAGLTNAEELLELMEQKAGKMIHSPKLRALLQWADNATAGAGGDISPTEKRAIALAFANTNAYANAYANPFANLYALAFAPNPFDNAFANTYPFTYRLTNAFVFADADTLDEFINSAHQLKQFQVFAQVNFPQLLENLEMFKAKIPQYNSSQEVQTAFFEKVIETWLNSFHLTLEMVTLSKKELKEWRNYSYVNLLIVKCKEAAARVSQKSWSKIEERMLRLQ
ncbi:MAG: hypothetical protein GDA44_11220 [Prochloron sp. SP5CPC1]|nr:hypothetical protein [Candidatus Paraprochloron terpiosi SP5CPC1]